jgi:two-component sensor histidine kinase
MTDIHELVERRIRQDVLISELHHRARNLLAITWAIANKTIRRCGSLEKFKEEFRQRIGALARVQELRCGNQDLDVGLQELVSAQLKAHTAVDAGSSKVAIEGPPVALSPISAQTLGLALHELATNAVKYGALSQAGGSLLVTWEVGAPGDPTVRISWKETGVQVPPDALRRSGYGTELIKRALPFDLGAKTELWFEPDGLRCTIEVRRERLAVVERDL